jgi:copper chaperone
MAMRLSLPPWEGPDWLQSITLQEAAMLKLNVTRMTCAHCVRAVTQAVKALDPQAQVQVDLGGKSLRVEGRSSVDAVIRALGEAGYPAAVVARDAAPVAADRKGCCGCR